VKRISLFYILLVGGLIFTFEALFLMYTEFLPPRPDVQWYLLGMGQTMMGVGLVGVVLNRKQKKEVK